MKNCLRFGRSMNQGMPQAIFRFRNRTLQTTGISHFLTVYLYGRITQSMPMTVPIYLTASLTSSEIHYSSEYFRTEQGKASR